MYTKESSFIYLFICLCICFSCSNKSKTNEFVEKNFNQYQNEYKIANDSIKLYVNSLLEEFKNLYRQNWRIDSLVCINSNGDKLITTINNSNGLGESGVSDAITQLLGKKVKNRWYFIQGSALIVPRDMYGKDAMHPLTFHELSQIARKEMFSENALVKINGEYVVNDAWVEEHFYNNGFYTFGKHKVSGMISAGEQFKMPRDKEKFDSVHWAIIMEKWNHKIDTVEYKKQSQNYP